MSHEEATNCIFLNEAKNKGWDTEKPKDPAPPEPKESDSSEAKDRDVRFSPSALLLLKEKT